MLTVLKKKLPSKCDNFAPKLQKKINKEMLITRILFCRWQKNIFLNQPLLLSFALFIVTLAHTNCPQQQVAIFTDCKSELLQTDNKNFPTAALIHTLRWILRKWGTLHSIACASLRINCHNCLSEQVAIFFRLARTHLVANPPDDKNFPAAALIQTLRWILSKWGT